jgi:NAD-dependent SIR2 family protein deacetylase
MTDASLDDQVRKAAAAVQGEDALLVTAGAGMGVDSGLPDFRGTQGFWRAYPVIDQRAATVGDHLFTYHGNLFAHPLAIEKWLQ